MHSAPKISLVLGGYAAAARSACAHLRLLAQGRIHAPRRRSRLLRAQILSILVVRLRVACHSCGSSSGAAALSSIRRVRAAAAKPPKKMCMNATVQHLVKCRASGIAAHASVQGFRRARAALQPMSQPGVCDAGAWPTLQTRQPLRPCRSLACRDMNKRRSHA